MNHSMPGLPVHHQLPEFTQTRVYLVSDAIQLSHPLLSPSPPAPNPFQHQSLFQWVNSLRPHESQHARPPCPSPTPGVHPDPGPSSRWCHPTISSSVIPFSSCLQSFPASGYSPMSQFLISGSQSIGVSASTSVLPMNAHD